MKRNKDYSYIIDLIKEGNQKELCRELPELMEHISASVVATVSGFSYDEVYEITNSLYLKIYEKIESGRIKSHKTLLSYYYTSVRNECYRITRKKTTLIGGVTNPFMLYSDDNLPLVIESEDISPEEVMEEEDKVKRLYTAIEKLPKPQKDVIKVVLEYPGISGKAGSARLGINNTNFRILKHRAKNELKRILEKEYTRIPQY